MHTHAHIFPPPPTHTHTEPPSAPLNLQVFQVTNTSVQLSWDPPVSNGGRDDLEYQLSYQRAGVPDNVTMYNRVNVTVGQITGLRAFTQYVVMVSGENGVSAQATDASGRTVNATIITEPSSNATIITEPSSAPLNLTVLQVTNTTVQLSWDPPVSNGGRDDLEYQLSYQRAGVPERVRVYGRVNVTVGQITGLRPFTQYVVMVSVENEVSDQATDASWRTVSANITTEEGGEFRDF